MPGLEPTTCTDLLAVSALRRGAVSDSRAVSECRRKRNGTHAGAVWRPSLGKAGRSFSTVFFRSAKNGVRVLPLGGDRAGEVRRFLHNPRVTPSEMVATAHARTAGLVEGRQLLVIQDTCAMSAISAAGTYPAIAVDAKDGALLGLVHAVFLHRTGGKSGQPNNQPFAEKESKRWLDATCKAATLATAGAAWGDRHRRPGRRYLRDVRLPASRDRAAAPGPARPRAGRRLAAVRLH
jgi:hypothetical protein